MNLRSFALLLFLACPALAQTTASLTGTVTSAGKVLPGVTVTVSSPSLQGVRSAVTGDAGTYSFPALPPGGYMVVFSMSGLDEVRTTTRLELAETSRVDALMHIAAATATIDVVAATPSAIATPEVATNLTLREIERLPVQRNQLATAQFAPGVTANVLTNGQLQISGGPGYDNLVLVNGVVVTENVRDQIRPMYVEDAIEETTVLTGAISAEYGRFTGGVVNTISKSGGNALSGSGRDSLSNPSWSAQTPAKEARVDQLSHVTELTLGGSLLRDRLWFFGAGRRALNDTARQTVPIPAFTGTPSSAPSPAISYTEGNDQKRYEGKLTGTLTASQTIVGSYFKIDTLQTNARFAANLYDLASLTTNATPESLIAAHYVGLFGTRVVIEGQYSNRKMGSQTGSQSIDPIAGTVLLDRNNANSRFNSPTLCGVCDMEHRNNDDYLAKAHYLFDNERAGSHDLVAGFDRFEEQHYLNNHQSGSDFSIFATRAQWKDGVIYPVLTPTTPAGGGTFIRWNPILVPAQQNHLRTDSLFLNDNWSFGRHWSFLIGARYDRNRSVDADGTLVSNDARLEPRLSAQFDVTGDGRHRVSASYAEYVSHVADSIASSNQSAGNAAAIDFVYKGPPINDKALTVPLSDAIKQLLDYFNSQQGGTANTAAGNLRTGGLRTIPGYATYFGGSLASPYVREVTLGYGEQLGATGFARVDLVSRDWRDFYAASVTQSTRRGNTPLGIPVDFALIRNTNNVQRTYRGMQLQARWNPSRFQTGIFYTWSKLRGNDEGENATTGAAANIDPTLYYPEFLRYAQAAPIGYLPGDQRHRLRAWAGYDVPLPGIIGRLNVSLLQTYDSGLPYSAFAPISLTRYAGAPANPGYNAIPNGEYYFSERGQSRTDNITSTNLALRYSRPVAGGVELFVQGDLVNLFNNDGIADPTRLGTGVSTAANSATFAPFDPSKQIPIQCPTGAAAATCTGMGANYQLAANFGQPLNDLAYQSPRTYRFSLGVRF